MLRCPASPYYFSGEEEGRHTSVMYKYKPIDDAECRVLGPSQSASRGYECELPNGTVFSLSSIGDLSGPAAVGDVITFVSKGYLASGKPQYPKAVCVRTDRDWDDICAATCAASLGKRKR